MTSLATALVGHKVSAQVVDTDHYGIHGGLAVETDYIVEVHIGEEGGDFDTFKISKKYSDFRDLASSIRKAAKIATGGEVKKAHKWEKSGDWNSLSKSAKHLVTFSESLSHLVEAERTNYLGKLTYTYVKSISKQRRSIIDQALDMILEDYPKTDLQEPGVVALTKSVETFFLTDHVEEDLETSSSSSVRKKNSIKTKPSPATSPQTSPKKTEGVKVAPKSAPIQESAKESAKSSEGSAHVVPLSRKSRKSVVVRAQEERLLNEVGAKLIIEEEKIPEDVTSAPAPSLDSSPILGGTFDSPFAFAAVAVAAIYALHFTSQSTVTVDSDIALFIGFAFFCLGLHSPRSAGTAVVKPPPPKPKKPIVSFEEAQATRRQSRLLRKSMVQSMKSMRHLAHVPEGEEEEEEDLIDMEEEEEEGHEQLLSPLPTFPEGAELGTVPNCVSETPPSDYNVRGANYLSDKKKIPSGPFIFSFRGVDLFLTDLCPENVGGNPGAMGGRLREKPTFIVNFRLPWAVLCFYAEIPAKLLPFLHACYDPDFDKSTLPSMKILTPPERAAARYLMGNEDHKNECLKIIPVVVKGPWVVKSVVGGKPAIIGNKMPVTYYYQPAEKGKAEYLEMDLDVVASSAARGILSVVKNYTSILTLDLGFVVEGKTEDELPEQMMVGTRLHSIDPLTAPPLPPTPELFLEVLSGADDDSD